MADDPPVDCFYVYPTTSFDEGPNSDWEPAEAEEIHTVYNQTARLTSTCRVFAPVYRQATLSAIGGGAREEGVEPWTVAYGDVVDAFKDYVVNSSEGRGFVLIGHSQGSGVLTRLIAEEVGLDARTSPADESSEDVGGTIVHYARETVAVAAGRVIGFRRLVGLDEAVTGVRNESNTG